VSDDFRNLVLREIRSGWLNGGFVNLRTGLEKIELD